jgi:hypothetical protein
MHTGLVHEDKEVLSITPVKRPVNNRYFIELQVTADPDAPRFLKDEIRRHSAIEFARVIGEWLKDNDLQGEVSDLSVTALGQIMIVCTQQVINLIREQDIWAVAHIRASDQFNENSMIKRVSPKQKESA